MRLTNQQLEIIIAAFKSKFGPEDHLWLFGSRVDDSKRGGDIDLYVQTLLDVDASLVAKRGFWTALQLGLGEQKIDIVIHRLSCDFHLPIYDVAQQEGIILV